MSTNKDNIRFQAEKHPLVSPESYTFIEHLCIDLMHRKAYEVAAQMAHDLTVLDFGCNDGYGTNIISECCAEIAGVDVSPKAIEKARSRYEQEGIEFILFDGNRTPFNDASFDMIVSFQVIEHIVDIASYLSEIRRIVAPNGIVIFTTPNASIRLDPGMKPWNQFHIKEFSHLELYDLLINWFPKVAVQGLFANEALYEVEFNRNKKALEKARRKSWLPPPWMIKGAIFNAVKAALPNKLYESLRKVYHKHKKSKDKQEPKLLDRSIIQKYSTADFFYLEENLEQALDLMAICYCGKKND